MKGRIEGQGGISNVYDPHYCYYTLYGYRDVLRVSVKPSRLLSYTVNVLGCIEGLIISHFKLFLVIFWKMKRKTRLNIIMMHAHFYIKFIPLCLK